MDQQMPDPLHLPLSERIQLVEDLWDSIAAESEGLPLPDWQKEELARREAEYARDPGLASTWEEAKQRILSRHVR
jgi:putative addiction module component (TIGR02574 family)